MNVPLNCIFLKSVTYDSLTFRLPKLQHVLQGYGMTECGEPTTEVWAVKGPKPGSVGMASPGIIIKASRDFLLIRNYYGLLTLSTDFSVN